MLTQKRLKQLVAYDPDTGIFRSRVQRSNCAVGKILGTISGDGRYLRFSVDYRLYYSHRLAWLYVHGRWPKGIDHKNHDGTDNRMINLREANQSQNNANNRQPKSLVGLRGVTLSANKKWYRASITKNGECFWLGNFSTPQEAHVAYKNKAKELYGEFA